MKVERNHTHLTSTDDGTAWLFSRIGPHQVQKYLHTPLNLVWCDINWSYMQYCSTHHWQGLNVLARLLLQWSLIILPSERTWYDTVLHDTIYSSTLSGHRSQYSYLNEQELLDSVHCPFHISLHEVLHKVYISMACTSVNYILSMYKTHEVIII